MPITFQNPHFRGNFFWITATFVAVFFSFCSLPTEPMDGSQLAGAYCATCHAYPEPQLLDQATWKNYVLPRMGQFLGIYKNQKQRDTLLNQDGSSSYLQEKNIYPASPLLSNDEWLAIQEFYIKNAPQQLRVAPLTTQKSNLFQARFPDIFLSPPSSTYIELDSQTLYFSDANKQVFVELDEQLKVKRQAMVGEGLVHVEQEQDAFWLTLMGSFSPTDQAKGYVFKLSTQSSEPSQKVITNLQRPVHSSYSDFNADGLIDILICEYGKWTGALSLWLQNKDGKFSRHNLVERSGAIATEVLDINQDGLSDFIALFGQGDESLQLFINQGNQKFKSRRLVSLHPSMGSSSFSLFDFNGDQKLDIIYTAGDNADYPPVIKPYHGIYVYEQKANFVFEQTLFLPSPGAYRAIPADFDLDGDIDIASISFFPDYDQQAQEFVFFENNNQQFIPKTINLQQMGRWIVMDIGDIDADGDLDLALASLSFEAPGHPNLIDQWIKNGIPFVLLENRSR